MRDESIGALGRDNGGELSMGDMLDQVSKGMAKATSRRQALKLFGAGLATTAVGSAFASSAIAAPQTCVTCICGVGQPCNPKSTTCTEVKAFPADQACAQACAAKNQSLCGMGTTFHCPQGCPS
jgi:hypothetical protein